MARIVQDALRAELLTSAELEDASAVTLAPMAGRQAPPWPPRSPGSPAARRPGERHESSTAAEDFDGSVRSRPEAAGSALPYATAAAFRTALKAKFTEIAVNDPRFSVAELQRQFAYDRILSRCPSADDAERWMLKGAGALLARLPVARHSKDFDRAG